MLTGINIHETRKYVSKRDPDKDNPTLFHVGVLDPFLRSWIEDKCTSIEFSSGGADDPAKGNVLAKKRNILLVKYGVRDIENFLDPQTKAPVKVTIGNTSIGGKSYPALPDQVISLLGTPLIDELAEEILREQDLGETERKN